VQKPENVRRMQKVNQQNLKFTDQSQMSTSLYYAYSGRFRAASEDGESRVLLWNLDRHLMFTHNTRHCSQTQTTVFGLVFR